MIYEQKPLCDVKTYVRVTEEMYNSVMAWPGKNFSDKYKNLFEYCFREKDKLKDDIEQLQRDKKQLQIEIEQARNVYAEMISKCQKMTEAQGKIENINRLLEDVQGIYEKMS